MALIDFTHDKERAPADAVWSEHHKVWTWKTHVGLCLEDHEINGYDDSDFYMVVWNEEKQAPERITYATTRGWSYPAYGSYVDATPEVRAKYEAWKAQRDEEARRERRRNQARVLRANRALWKAACERHALSIQEQMKFRRLPDWQVLLGLFSLRGRSAFRKSLRDQIIAWLRDPAPKYEYPLSRKQRARL